MAATTSYIIFLSPPLSTPEQIQDIARLPQRPEIRAINEEESDADEQDEYGEQPAASTSCCVVDRSTKDAIVEWARSSGVVLKPIIPIIQTESADTTVAHQDSYPVPYFLYGRLDSYALLRSILGLAQPPTLQRASVSDYETKTWDGKDALIPSATGRSVEGRVYMTISYDEVEKLADYEGFAFEVSKCHITYANGEVCEGNVFRYRGDRLGLEDLHEQI
ncbi:hypothetical protein G7Y79_00001g000330 [Physcia stellaris]|nr:hypothetical protein G7Y79_00001g000330 [Physcia stellaris]